MLHKVKTKLQNTPLQFGSIWILHLEVLEFKFYPLKFKCVWILHSEISEFEFMLWNLEVFGFYTLKF